MGKKIKNEAEPNFMALKPVQIAFNAKNCGSIISDCGVLLRSIKSNENVYRAVRCFTYDKRMELEQPVFFLVCFFLGDSIEAVLTPVCCPSIPVAQTNRRKYTRSYDEINIFFAKGSGC